MKILHLLITIGAAWNTLAAERPGALYFSSARAPTHIESLDGPLAGPGIWAQMMAGTTTDDLSLVGIPVEHRGSGIVLGGIVLVPFIECRSVGYVQMIAWDGGLWGLDPENVPPDQLGMTDAIRYAFGCPDFDPLGIPRFTQPAVVPIPEPSTLALLGTGSVAMIAGLVRGRKKGQPCNPERLQPGIRRDSLTRMHGLLDGDRNA